jgi:SAM-dependent methyltransferase
MTSPFETIAPRYDTLWSSTPRGRGQRAQVWREIDALYRPGDRILDLGCGTGDDALYLSGLGIDVYGIDSAAKMVEIAQARGVRAEKLDIEDLGRLEGPFSGALSNFGALNCVANLRSVASQLGRLVQPAGPVAICLMGRVCWPELARGVTRRLQGHASWRGMEVYYPSSRQVRHAFDPWFAFERRISIGYGDHQLYIFRRGAPC